MNGAADEIAKIEHELTTLRERYTIFQRGAEWVRRTLIAACVVLVGLVIWRLVLGDVFGAVLVVILSGIVLVSSLPYRKRRLIDIVSESGIAFYRGRSGAREVEQMIALREKRLTELKGQST